MSKKRKRLKKNYRFQSQKSSKHEQRRGTTGANAKEILTYIFQKNESITLADIHKGLANKRMGKQVIENTLQELVRSGLVHSAGKKRYRLDTHGKLYSGKIEKNPRGFGFVINLEPRSSAQFFTRDPFLSVKNMGTANHGDKVFINIKRVRKDGRPEAEIISILERSSERITGFYQPGKPSIVIPEDPRYPSKIRIIESANQEISPNEVVIVEILPEPSKQGFIQGRITEVIGPADNIDVQMRIVIEKHNLPHIFPAEVLKEARNLSFDNSDFGGRLDLRNTRHITIDGETAKDFDDAIAIEKNKAGYRLYVSIADVSHFVQPGSQLDKEAYLRGTSIYFPGRVIPMLPENLSNNLCSLVPNQDRLTFSAILDFDKKGTLLKKKFGKSVICSKQRFTYTTVKQILFSKEGKMRTKYKDFLPLLSGAKELAEILLNKRMTRGSIGFNIPEPDISLKDDGRISTIKRKERNFAHQIIEEFMLAANEAVAEIFTANSLDFLFRIHEKPDSEKVEEFASFAGSLGLELPPQSEEPSWFAAVLDGVRDSPREYVINNLLLRTMQQARYDPGNLGHFGLAATDYTHFTSPIRRYPDLLVHRLLHSFLQSKPQKSPLQENSLHEKGQYLSSRERAAVNAERDINDRLKIFYMEQFIGEDFKAVISGVSETSIFIELLDLFVNGAIDISTLRDDYYLYDPKRYRVIGEISGKAFQLGASINVTLTEVSHRRKRIYFAPSENE